jgi:hypothetical protein
MGLTGKSFYVRDHHHRSEDDLAAANAIGLGDHFCSSLCRLGLDSTTDTLHATSASQKAHDRFCGNFDQAYRHPARCAAFPLREVRMHWLQVENLVHKADPELTFADLGAATPEAHSSTGLRS